MLDSVSWRLKLDFGFKFNIIAFILNRNTANERDVI